MTAQSDPEYTFLRSGTIVGKYEILRTLGKGGCAITYCAENRATGEMVAIKEFFPSSLVWRGRDMRARPRDGIDPSCLEALGQQFFREAEIVSRFDHPNLVKGVEIFEGQDTAYLVMKYASGRSLRQCLRDEYSGLKVTPTLIAGLVSKLLDGLAYSHARDCFHCDIKPSNIFLGIDDHPVLLDFGAARSALGEMDPEEGEGRSANLYTAHYAPFEQCSPQGGRIGPWTDLYQLSAVVYRCLTGGKLPDGVARAESPHLFWPLAEFHPLPHGSWPPEFLKGIDWGLAAFPQGRPQSVGEWRNRLDPVLKEMARDRRFGIPDSPRHTVQSPPSRVLTPPEAIPIKRNETVTIHPEFPEENRPAPGPKTAALPGLRVVVFLLVLIAVILFLAVFLE